MMIANIHIEVVLVGGGQNNSWPPKKTPNMVEFFDYLDQHLSYKPTKPSDFKYQKGVSLGPSACLDSCLMMKVNIRPSQFF